MSWCVFVQVLNVPDVKGLLGVNVGDLKTYENTAPVQEWIRLQPQSDLDSLNIGLTGGRNSSVTETSTSTSTSSTSTSSTKAPSAAATTGNTHTPTNTSAYTQHLLRKTGRSHEALLRLLDSSLGLVKNTDFSLTSLVACAVQN